MAPVKRYSTLNLYKKTMDLLMVPFRKKSIKKIPKMDNIQKNAI